MSNDSCLCATGLEMPAPDLYEHYKSGLHTNLPLFPFIFEQRKRFECLSNRFDMQGCLSNLVQTSNQARHRIYNSFPRVL